MSNEQTSGASMSEQTSGASTYRQTSGRPADSLTDEQIRAALEECGALQKGHFKLTSGLHSDSYIQCARVQEHPRLLHELAAEATARLPEDLEVDLVAAPAVGGILFGFAVAAVLDTTFVFCERGSEGMEFRRSFSVKPGERVLVCEDVVTTGGSVRELIQLIRAAGAEVVGVVSMVDRGKTPDFSCSYFPLIILDTPSWPPEVCSLCQAGQKITKPGSRELAKNAVKP